MVNLAFCDYYNMVAILEKTEHNTDFHQIVDFLEASHIRYALTISPTIYVSHVRQFWTTARIETTDQETKIIATVDGKPWTIFESSLRRHLKLNDEEGISSLPDAELFENLSLMSKAFSPYPDEHASLLRDNRHGEAFPTVSSIGAGQDRENITKTSAMSHESSLKVPSLDADEGNKIKDHDIEISRLKARFKSLEDIERGREEPIQEDAPITRGIIDIGEGLGANKSTKKGSNDTEEMVNVLSSMEAVNILSSGGIHAKEELKLMIEGLDKSNDVIAKHLSKYKQVKADLSIGEKIELISELVKYQDHLDEILKYQAQQSKPSSKKEQRKCYMSKHMQDFVPMSSKEESKRIKRPGIKLDQGSSKRVKISHTSRLKPLQEQQFKGSKGVFEEELKGMMQLVPLEEVYTEALQVELKRLFEPDSEDQLWTYHQAFMHDPLDWKLYDTCGVHHVSTKKNQEIFMLVDKDYPLRKGLATVMISNKLQESLLGLILYRTPWPIQGVLRNLIPPLDNPELTIQRRYHVDHTLLNDFEMATKGNGDPPVPGQYQSKWVIDDAFRLYLFPHSLTHHATAWSDRLPRNSINTFEQMAKMFLGKYFPPSMVMKLRNEITNFHQQIVALKAEMAKINKNLIKVPQINQQVKAVTPSCETCGGPHSYNDCPATVGKPRTYMLREPTKVVILTNLKANDAILKNMQTNITSLTNSNLELKNMFGQFMKMNTTSSLGSGTLPSNTITNPKEDLKGITTRRGTAYQGPMIRTTSSSLPIVVEHETETGKALIDVYEGELTLRVSKEAITFNLDQTSRYSANYNDMTVKRIDVIDMVCEEYSQEVLGFSDVIGSGKPTPYYDPIVSTTSPTLTPFGDSDFLLEEVDAFLALEDDATLPAVDHSYYDTEGGILLFEAFLNDDPSLPPPNQRKYFPQVRKELKIYEAKNGKSLIDEPLEVELKDLPPHLEYVFLEGDDKLPVIIAKDLSVEEKAALMRVLKSHKQAIAWKLSDIKGINPEFCTHKILMEDDFEPAVQHQEKGQSKNIQCHQKGGYFQILIDPKDQKKTTFTYPYGMFAYRRMPFGLCDAPGTFQRCMMAMFHDMIEKMMEVFMADFLEKSHLMVKEGIVLGHKISKNCIKCIEAFQTLKNKLTKAPILVASDLDLPFELMCDASDFAIGAVLGNSSTSWFADFENYHTGNFVVKGMSSQQKNKFFKDVKHYFWDDPFLFKIMLIKSYGGVCMARKPLTFSRLAIMDPPRDTMARTTPPKRLSGPSVQLSKHPSGVLRISSCTERHVIYRLSLSTKPTAGDHQKVQLNELNELRDQAYENSLIYKEKTKIIHDSKIKDRVFNVCDQVLLFNSRLKIFSGKLKTRWSRPFTITHVFPYGTVKLSHTDGLNFMVNGHRLKHYFGEDIPKMVVPDLQTFPKDQ
nr:reverse transcriptase domain-containing protein [Tanacetum cinerariifolium]